MLTTEWYFWMKENNPICGRTWTQEVFGLRRRFKSGRLGQQRRAGGPKGTNKTKLRGSRSNFPHRRESAVRGRSEAGSPASFTAQGGTGRGRVFPGRTLVSTYWGVQSPCGSVRVRLELGLWTTLLPYQANANARTSFNGVITFLKVIEGRDYLF